MKYLKRLAIVTAILATGCDDVAPAGPCQDSVKILTPNLASSTNEHICSRGAKLKVSDKDQSIVALCRCSDSSAGPASSSNVDAGVPEEKK